MAYLTLTMVTITSFSSDLTMVTNPQSATGFLGPEMNHGSIYQ